MSEYTREEILRLIEENVGSGGRRTAKLTSNWTKSDANRGGAKKMDWTKESTRRLAEAARLRQEIQASGDELLAIQKKRRSKRRSYHDLQRQHGTVHQAARLEWVQSEEARSPDPRTGRSNPEWRKLLWAKAKQESEELAGLTRVVELADQELNQLGAEVQELETRLAIAFEQANILQAELNCLAALVGQS